VEGQRLVATTRALPNDIIPKDVPLGVFGAIKEPYYHLDLNPNIQRLTTGLGINLDLPESLKDPRFLSSQNALGDFTTQDYATRHPGIRVSFDGKSGHEVITRLNARLESMSSGSGYNSLRLVGVQGKIESIAYLEHSANGLVPIDSTGRWFVHDMTTHTVANLVLPENAVTASKEFSAKILDLHQAVQDMPNTTEKLALEKAVLAVADDYVGRLDRVGFGVFKELANGGSPTAIRGTLRNLVPQTSNFEDIMKSELNDFRLTPGGPKVFNNASIKKLLEHPQISQSLASAGQVSRKYDDSFARNWSQEMTRNIDRAQTYAFVGAAQAALRNTIPSSVHYLITKPQLPDFDPTTNGGQVHGSELRGRLSILAEGHLSDASTARQLIWIQKSTTEARIFADSVSSQSVNSLKAAYKPLSSLIPGHKGSLLDLPNGKISIPELEFDKDISPNQLKAVVNLKAAEIHTHATNIAARANAIVESYDYQKSPETREFLASLRDQEVDHYKEIKVSSGVAVRSATLPSSNYLTNLTLTNGPVPNSVIRASLGDNRSLSALVGAPEGAYSSAERSAFQKAAVGEVLGAPLPASIQGPFILSPTSVVVLTGLSVVGSVLEFKTKYEAAKTPEAKMVLVQTLVKDTAISATVGIVVVKGLPVVPTAVGAAARFLTQEAAAGAFAIRASEALLRLGIKFVATPLIVVDGALGVKAIMDYSGATDYIHGKIGNQVQAFLEKNLGVSNRYVMRFDQFLTTTQAFFSSDASSNGPPEISGSTMDDEGFGLGDVPDDATIVITGNWFTSNGGQTYYWIGSDSFTDGMKLQHERSVKTLKGPDIKVIFESGERPDPNLAPANIPPSVSGEIGVADSNGRSILADPGSPIQQQAQVIEITGRRVTDYSLAAARELASAEANTQNSSRHLDLAEQHSHAVYLNGEQLLDKIALANISSTGSAVKIDFGYEIVPANSTTSSGGINWSGERSIQADKIQLGVAFDKTNYAATEYVLKANLGYDLQDQQAIAEALIDPPSIPVFQSADALVIPPMERSPSGTIVVPTGITIENSNSVAVPYKPTFLEGVGISVVVSAVLNGGDIKEAIKTTVQNTAQNYVGNVAFDAIDDALGGTQVLGGVGNYVGSIIQALRGDVKGAIVSAAIGAALQPMLTAVCVAIGGPLGLIVSGILGGFLGGLIGGLFASKPPPPPNWIEALKTNPKAIGAVLLEGNGFKFSYSRPANPNRFDYGAQTFAGGNYQDAIFTGLDGKTIAVGWAGLSSYHYPSAELQKIFQSTGLEDLSQAKGYGSDTQAYTPPSLSSPIMGGYRGGDRPVPARGLNVEAVCDATTFRACKFNYKLKIEQLKVPASAMAPFCVGGGNGGDSDQQPLCYKPGDRVCTFTDNSNGDGGGGTTTCKNYGGPAFQYKNTEALILAQEFKPDRPSLSYYVNDENPCNFGGKIFRSGTSIQVYTRIACSSSKITLSCDDGLVTANRNTDWTKLRVKCDDSIADAEPFPRAN